MKILWFCNIILPRIASHISGKIVNMGGWLVGLSDNLLKSDGVELSVVCPMQNLQDVISGKVGNLKYFGFPQKKSDVYKYNHNIEGYAETVITQVNPDIVHIFGTEFPHTLAVVNACERLGIINKVIINIQGLVSVYAKHYYSGLPNNIIYNFSFRDFIKQDNIRQQQKSFVKRGKYEIEALQKVHHVIGRTDWDKACTSQINPLAQYHFCNETLRDEFYNHDWDITKCERYSIFISQASYPIKGLHVVLEALPEIIKSFPDTHVYVAGNDITKTDTLMAKIKINSYGVYIKYLIEKYKLENYITFTGSLNEQKMCERFLKSYVFVSPSSIENSPNSLGEAMLLGVPVISSDVGGVKNMMTHNEDGFIYQFNAPYMFTYYVCQLFENDELALKFSENARKHAIITHDRKNNLHEILKIYNTIFEELE